MYKKERQQRLYLRQRLTEMEAQYRSLTHTLNGLRHAKEDAAYVR